MNFICYHCKFQVKQATAARLVQSKITQMMAAKGERPKPPNPLLRGSGGSKRRASQEARGSSPSTSAPPSKQQKGEIWNFVTYMLRTGPGLKEWMVVRTP